MRRLALLLVLGCNQGALSEPDPAWHVICGKVSCDLSAGMFCCDDYLHGPRCATSCPVGDWLACDGPEDCPNGVCCGNYGPEQQSTAICMAIGSLCQLGYLCHDDCGGSCEPINPGSFPGVETCR